MRCALRHGEGKIDGPEQEGVAYTHQHCRAQYDDRLRDDLCVVCGCRGISSDDNRCGDCHAKDSWRYYGYL